MAPSEETVTDEGLMVALQLSSPTLPAFGVTDKEFVLESGA